MTHAETLPPEVRQADPRLTQDQKAALLAVYRSYVEAGG